MGSGIAQLALQSGFSVLLHDASKDALGRGASRVRAGLEKGVARRKLTPEQSQTALSRLKTASRLSEFSACPLVIEAAFEDIKVKREIFAALESALPAAAVLGTNTSSLSVGEIARGLKNPKRLVGMHFFNPPVVMKLLEIVRHAGTSDAAFKRAWALALALGRAPVEVKDTAGFLVNRVVRSYYLVAQRLAAEGAGSFAGIDAAVKKIGEVPMGPFELMDYIGLEVNLAISRAIYEGLGSPERLRPHAIQENIVASGAHGRKTGRGFYVYGDGAQIRENPDALALLPAKRPGLAAEVLWERIMSAIAAEAQIVVAEGVASREGVDTAVRLAMNFPKGPFEWKSAAAKA